MFRGELAVGFREGKFNSSANAPEIDECVFQKKTLQLPICGWPVKISEWPKNVQLLGVFSGGCWKVEKIVPYQVLTYTDWLFNSGILIYWLMK